MRKFLPKNTRVRLAFNAIATMAVGTTALCCFIFLCTYIPGYLCDLDLAKVTTHEIVLDDVDIKAIRCRSSSHEGKLERFSAPLPQPILLAV